MYTAGALSQVIKEKHQLNGKRFKDDYSLRSKNVELSFFTFQAFWPVHCIKFRAIVLPRKKCTLKELIKRGKLTSYLTRNQITEKDGGHIWISESRSKDPSNVKAFSASPHRMLLSLLSRIGLSVRLHKDTVLKSTGLEIYHCYNLRRH